MEGVFNRFNLQVGEEIKKGEAVLSTYEFKKDPLFNMRAIMDGGLMYMEEGKYVRLHVGGDLMMSDTRMEKRSNSDFAHHANGRVLIAGLGIGLILNSLKEKVKSKEITSITVVEKSKDVIDLVSPYFMDIPIKYVNEDIFEYKTKEKFDTIYFDIWPVISEDNLEDIKLLHNKFKNNLDRTYGNHWMNSWMNEHLKRERRRNKSRYPW